MSHEEQPYGARATRLYVGNLPTEVQKRHLEQLFQKYGNILDVSVKRTVSGAPFAFIEFDDERDAHEAIRARDGYDYNGYRLRVEIPFAARGEPRGRGSGRGRGGGGGGGGGPRRGEHRIVVSGLPRSGSWQDLKDHMRDAGECLYADVYRDGTGVVEFSRREDVDYALKYMNDSKFRSHEGETSRLVVRQPDDGGRRSMSPNYRRQDFPRRGDSRDGGRNHHGDMSPPRYGSRYSEHRRFSGGEDRPRGRRSPSPYYGRSASRSRSRSRR